jgi:4-hydroxy-tetrahydrodipicolinate reductase
MVVVINGVNGRIGNMLYEYYKDKFDIIGVDTKACGFSSFNNIQGINRKIDLVIDFSSTSAFKDLIYALENKIKVISGTTGYDKKQLEMLKEIGNDNFYHSSNYAKGIKTFTRILKEINKEYKTFDFIETHSSKKKDSPSGTAKMVANELEFDYSKIQSLRLKDSNPIHEIIFMDDNEKITISHEITNPLAFIEGFDEILRQIIT